MFATALAWATAVFLPAVQSTWLPAVQRLLGL